MENILISAEQYPFSDDQAKYLKESLKHVPDSKDIFPPRLIMAGIIDWKDKNDAAAWGGPFNEQYVGCKITDYTYSYELEPKEIIDLRETLYNKYSSFNIPFSAFKRIFNSDQRTFPLLTKDGTLCGRSDLTQKELNLFLNNATKQERDEWETNIDQPLTWSKERPSKQYPVKIYLFGNDDCSYTRLCEDEEQAIMVIKEIVAKPNMKYIYNCFVFTN